MALSDKDVDESIASDWAEIRERYTPEPVDPVADDAPDATPEADTDPVETIPVSRKPDGKFKAQDDKDKSAKDAKAAKVEKTTPAAAKPLTGAPSQEDVGSATAEPSTDQPQARDTTRAPSTWKPAAREKYAALPPEIKAEIHRREADFLNGQAQLRPDAEMGRELRGIIEPYRGLIEAEGGTPALAVRDLFRTAAVFRTGSMQQKYAQVAQIARQFGLDLRVFSGQPATANGNQPTQQQPQEFRDPRVDTLLAQQQQREQQTLQREQQQLESTVIRWMNENDAQGNPKRQYLNDVINDVAALVPSLQEADPSLTHAAALDAAYDRAIWAHPEIRALLTQKQQAELDAQRRTENQNRVRDARRAGSVNVARRASIPTPGKPGRMEDTIAETARAIGMIE